MTTMSLAQLSIHPHGFSTGTENTPGRLILRDVQPQEVTQLKHILLSNNKHEGANPAWANITDWDVQLKIDKHLREISHTIHLHILLKPHFDGHMKTELKFDRAKFLINGITPVVGCLSLDLRQHPNDPKDSVAHIGIIIHYEVAKLKFGKEALIAILDYILLGQPTTMSNGNLGGLGLGKAFVETGMKNFTMQALMGSLHLKHLAREGTPDCGMRKGMSVPSVAYAIKKDDWLEARKGVVMEWMPVGKQGLAGDGSLYFSEIGPEHEHHSGSDHASGSVSGHAPGVGLSSVHGNGGHGAHR
jgi:RimJ/RimL family protein N-acetyltransferase